MPTAPLASGTQEQPGFGKRHCTDSGLTLAVSGLKLDEGLALSAKQQGLVPRSARFMPCSPLFQFEVEVLRGDDVGIAVPAAGAFIARYGSTHCCMQGTGA